MTVSVVDALRIAMTRCWNIDADRPDLEGIRAVAHLQMFQNGRVRSMWFEGQTRADTDPTFAYVFDTIRHAIDTCQPFNMLPREEFESWRTIRLTFFPSGKVVE